MTRYDTDNPADVEALKSMKRAPEVWPRDFDNGLVYGSAEAFEAGIVPVEAVPNKVIPRDQYKERLAEAHDLKTLPIYHQYATWAPKGTFRYNQNGLGYCWTWSGTGCLMTTRAMESKETVLLAPVSMGWLVNWANRGNYLESYIRGAREKGVAPANYCGGINSTNRRPNTYEDGWEEARASYRLDQVWDTNPRAGDQTMIQHCLSILCYGRSLFIAYNWWGHALECVGIRWDESEQNNIVWQIRNSHNENDVIELTGSRGVPDEAYGFIDTVTV